MAALPDGNVVALPAAPAPQARLQVIHNAADPAASQVDIYLNGSILLDDFAFRAATPFVDVPAEVQLSIGVAPASSTGPQDIIATFTPTLDAGKTYVAVAGRPKLSIPLYLQVAGVMAASGDVEAAEKIVMAVFKRKPDAPSLPATLVKLAEAFRKEGRTNRWRRCRQLICRHFPDSVEAAMILQSDSSI